MTGKILANFVIQLDFELPDCRFDLQMQALSRDSQIFHLNLYGLKINSACYLVTVCNATDRENFDPIQDLPDWVFTSKDAIWLTEEEKPIADRARNGDKIRRQLLALRRKQG